MQVYGRSFVLRGGLLCMIKFGGFRQDRERMSG